jgi:hypothetical protein
MRNRREFNVIIPPPARGCSSPAFPPNGLKQFRLLIEKTSKYQITQQDLIFSTFSYPVIKWMIFLI